MAEKYIVSAEVKRFVKSMNLKISNQAIIIVNGRVEEIVKKAAVRAKLNRRKTIMPHDI